eukprot:g271.t1
MLCFRKNCFGNKLSLLSHSSRHLSHSKLFTTSSFRKSATKVAVFGFGASAVAAYWNWKYADESNLYHKKKNFSESLLVANTEGSGLNLNASSPDELWATYLVVGGGACGLEAVQTLRKHAGPGDVICLVAGSDMDRPRINRVVKSGAQRTEAQSLAINLSDTNQQSGESGIGGGAVIVRGQRAVSIDAGKRFLTLEDGTLIHFSKCLLATGSKREELKGVDKEAKSRVVSVRTNSDVQLLEQLVSRGLVRHVTVVGGGFLGCEVAALLCSSRRQDPMEQTRIVLLCAERSPLSRFFPRYLSDYAGRRLKEEGVFILPGTFLFDVHVRRSSKPTDPTHSKKVESLRGDNMNELVLSTHAVMGSDAHKRDREGMSINSISSTDLVVFAPTHSKAETDLLGDAIVRGGEGGNKSYSLPIASSENRSAIKIDPRNGGICVDENLVVVGVSDVYAAGDVASIPLTYPVETESNADDAPDQSRIRRRVQQYDHAVASGRSAAENMVRAVARDRLATCQARGIQIPSPGASLPKETIKTSNRKTSSSNSNSSADDATLRLNAVSAANVVQKLGLKARPYTYQAALWSHLPGLRTEGVGRIDANLESIGFWQTEPSNTTNTSSNEDGIGVQVDYKCGVLFYMHGNGVEKRVVGVLLCNMGDGRTLSSEDLILRHAREIIGRRVGDVKQEYGSLFKAVLKGKDFLRWDLCKRQPRRRGRVSSVDMMRARLYEERDPNTVTRSRSFKRGRFEEEAN